MKFVFDKKKTTQANWRLASLLSLLSIMIILTSTEQSKLQAKSFLKNPGQASPWCFTQPKDGKNWGFVKDPAPTRKKYTVTLDTSVRPKSGTSSKIWMKLIGTQTATEWILFSTGFLGPADSRSKDVESRDLGTVTKVRLKIVGEECYRPRRVRVAVGNGTEFSYEALRAICPCKPSEKDISKCELDLFEEGNVTYNVTIKTRDEIDSEYDGVITIILAGSKNISAEKIFSETGCERGSSIVRQIKSIDIGEIVGYKLKMGQKGKWKPSLVIINSDSNGSEKTFQIKKDMQFPGQMSATGENFEDNPYLKNGLGSEENNEFGGDHNIFGSNTPPYNKFHNAVASAGGGFSGDHNKAGFYDEIMLEGVEPTQDGKTQLGSMTSGDEKGKMLKLTCTQELVNPDEDTNLFGPEGAVNFFSILASCPIGCDKYSNVVYGVGIHPEKTPICLAAIVDKAMPPTGGLIAINIFPKLSKYPISSGWKKIGKITVKAFTEQAKKSFTVAKVDNIDMVEKDIRIVDYNGNITHEGRVEFRMDGTWGSLCFKGVNEYAAVRICKDLQFSYGKWLNPDPRMEENKGFCRHFKGEDYCGSDYTRAIFSDLNCNPKDISINNCGKKDANPGSCDHSFDAILSCTNEDVESKVSSNSVEAVNGTVRLEAHQKIEGEEIGRLEVFEKQHWGAVCEIDFTNEAAGVACRQMGYDTGRWYTETDAGRWKKDKDDNFPFTANKVACGGNETTFKECDYQRLDIHCKHYQDVVIACRGEKGDPSSKSQTNPKVVTEAPSLDRLGMTFNKITCETTLKDKKIFRGDPGSVYIIECPPGCESAPGMIWGTGVYGSESNICMSATHAGVIQGPKGGTFVLVKSFGQKYLEETESFGIRSGKWEQETEVTFTFTKQWSNYMNYYSLLSHNNLTNINHKSIATQSFFQGLLNKAADYLGFKKGNNDDQKNYHANQPTSYNSNLLVDSNSAEIRIDDSPFVNEGGANLTGALSYVSFLGLGEKVSLRAGSEVRSRARARSRIMTGLNSSVSSTALSTSKSTLRGLKTAYQWVESDGTHMFNEFGKLIDNKKISGLDSLYTLFLNFVLEDQRRAGNAEIGDMFIFSYPGCGGFNIWIDNQFNLNFGDPCDAPKRWNTGLKVPLKDKCYIYLQYNNGKIILKFRELKVGDHFEQVIDFHLPIPERGDKIGLGCKASDQGSVFIGRIEFIVLYNSLEDARMINQLIDEIEKGKKNNEGIQDLPSTEEGNKCISPLNTGPTPGQPGSATAPPAANPDLGAPTGNLPPDKPVNAGNDPNQNDVYDGHPYKPNTSFVENSGIIQTVKDFLFGKPKPAVTPAPNPPRPVNPADQTPAYKPNLEDNVSTKILNCASNAMDREFNMKIGKPFRVFCPSCIHDHQLVFGSKNYHPRSSICRAALHSGVIAPGEKGDVILEITKAFPNFTGNQGEAGFLSKNMGGSEFSFQVHAAPPQKILTCRTKGNEGEFSIAKKDVKQMAVCPKNCSKDTGAPPVKGSEIYTDDSPICRSAFHSGVIGDQGGEVQFMFIDGQEEYKGTQGFEIKSLAARNQLRSFSFLGVKSSIFHTFEERCKGSITDRYKIINDENTEYKHENRWKLYSNPEWINNESQKESICAINHEGRIRNKAKGIVYATILQYTELNAEWANGVIRANFMFFSKEGKAALLFRFHDKENHYGLVFDMSDLTNNLKLYSKLEGSTEIIEGKMVSVPVSIWHRVSVYLDYNNVKVTMQVGNVKAEKELFNKPMKGLQRGTFALGVDNSRRIFFSSVAVEKWDPSTLRNPVNSGLRCVIDKVHKDVSENARKAYCRKVMRGFSTQRFIECVEPHMFCKLKCDENINSVSERIQNFCCFKSCVNMINNATAPAMLSQHPWEPVSGERVDFLPRGENIPVEAVVISVRDDQMEKNTKVVLLKYLLPDGGASSAEEKFTLGSTMLSKCGEKLTNRRDCNKPTS